MSINYDWTRSEENPLVDLETLKHLKTGLEAAFGDSFNNLKDVFQFLIKKDDNGYYIEDSEGNRYDLGDSEHDIKSILERLDKIDGGGSDSSDSSLEKRVKAIEDELDGLADFLEEYI